MGRAGVGGGGAIILCSGGLGKLEGKKDDIIKTIHRGVKLWGCVKWFSVMSCTGIVVWPSRTRTSRTLPSSSRADP